MARLEKCRSVVVEDQMVDKMMAEEEVKLVLVIGAVPEWVVVK